MGMGFGLTQPAFLYPARVQRGGSKQHKNTNKGAPPSVFLGSGSGKKAKGRGRLNACGCGGSKILLEVDGGKGKERNSEIERGGKNCMCDGVSGVVSVCVSLVVLVLLDLVGFAPGRLWIRPKGVRVSRCIGAYIGVLGLSPVLVGSGLCPW